jgi:hypothetical protein
VLTDHALHGGVGDGDDDIVAFQQAGGLADVYINNNAKGNRPGSELVTSPNSVASDTVYTWAENNFIKQTPMTFMAGIVADGRATGYFSDFDNDGT